MGGEGIQLAVEQVAREAEGILRYELRRRGGGPLPRFTAGAHVELEVPGGFRRAYSLCNDPAESNRYVIAVQREAQGRGGSRAMHEQVTAGQALFGSEPRNSFGLVDAERYVLIAGGIGVTPLLSMAHTLRRDGRSFALHYCTRDEARTAFRNEIRSPELRERVFVHHDGGDPSRGLNVEALLAEPVKGTHLYCCGPKGLMDAVRAASVRWLPETVHFESFGVSAEAGDAAFEVELASTGQVIPVGAKETILQALRGHGVTLPSDCEAGSCGTCVTGLLAGEADHRDSYLGKAERRSNVAICPCVSRAKCKRLKLDL
jgi:vanillate O-demethylase ferredoxin subunit